jgi:hypothetical protein
MSQLMHRSAEFAPETFDVERNTIRVIFSTGAEVRRRDIAGEFLERLALSPENVNLEYFRGAPVLNNHDRFSGVEAVLGIVDDARVDGVRGEATVKFGTRQEIQGIIADIRAGIIRNVSVGYTVESWRETRENGNRVKIAERWTPRELSFVPLGADPGAQVRSNGGDMQTTTDGGLLEQARSIAVALALPESAAAEAVAQHNSLDAVRTALIKRVADAQPLIDARTPTVTVTRDHADGLIERMADGLAARVIPNHKPEAGRQYAYHRLADFARDILRERGLSTLGSPAELLARAMHTTSDFAVLLQETFNKALFPLRTAPSPITQILRRTTMADFRKRHILEVSDGPALEEIGEGGEVRFGTIEGRELASYRLASYAKGFAISFQTLVNDDIGALADISEKIARGARQWFTSFLVDTIIANPTLADNKAVFHTDHGNLASTGAAPSDTTIAAARLAIRKQTDLSGNPIGASPRFILISAALETTVDKLLATLYPTSSTQAETAARGLTPLIEPRLDAKNQAAAWYLFCSPDDAPVFEYAELQGYEGPRVESRPGWNTLGTEFRVVWHLGAGAIDYRGAFKNPGA